MISAIPVPDNDPRRQSVRDWLGEHPAPSARDLVEAGYAAPHWPEPWGKGADAMTQLVIEDELQRAGVSLPLNPNAILFTGPSLLLGGTDEQRARYLPPMLAAEEMWCRLYSEPDAGSDLAAIRTRGERRGDVFVINGGKLWAPLAQIAVLGGLLVRTGGKPGERGGLTYLICPMDLPGITLNRVRDLAGGYRFNELFFDNVEIPVQNLVGVENEGIVVAESRFHYERVTTARGAAFGNGPGAPDLIEFIKHEGIELDPIMRDRVATIYGDSEILRAMAISIARSRQLGYETEPTERARKILLERHGRSLGFLAGDLTSGGGGIVPDSDNAAEMFWHNAFLSAASITIGAGTPEIQLEELGDILLGT